MVGCCPQVTPKCFLTEAYKHAGHQGVERTLARLMQNAYWVGMAQDVGQYCSCCIKCQITKALPHVPYSAKHSESPSHTPPLITPWEIE